MNLLGDPEARTRLTPLPATARHLIATRWATDSGMGNERSAADFSDESCRVLAEQGFTDVNALLRELDRIEVILLRMKSMLAEWDATRLFSS